MLNRIPFKRLAAIAAALPALLTGAAQAQEAKPSVSSATSPATPGKANAKPLLKIATYTKHCCMALVGYNNKGEVLLQSPDGQNFSFNDSGQRIHIKHITSDVSASANRAPIKESNGDISADAAKAAPQKSAAHSSERSTDFFLKFTSTHNRIEVLGITAQKQQVFKNQRGETFIINPANGDFIFINVAQ